MAHQLWSGQDPLGKRIKHGFSKGEAEVIGVVDDVRYAGLDQKIKPELYAPFDERPFPFMRVVVRTKSDPAKLVAALKSEVQAIDKNQPIDKVTTMTELVSRSMATRRFYMQLLVVFASLAFVLASVGIYGIVSYSVTQRTREIGIRLALGASRKDVLQMVLGEGFRLAIAGIGLGLAGAFAATRVLTSLLFEVKPTDPPTFIGLSLLLAMVALLASYVPARRATKVDPLQALRYE
jgi:putative ABC transport system permease protein